VKTPCRAVRVGGTATPVRTDNTCDFCREGLHTSCRHGGGWGSDGVDGGQGEAVRVPQAHHAKYDRYGPAIVGTVVGAKAAPVTIRLVPNS
jgi:threonine dehydrogenase-like Zn-dependent dehydrogenase